MTEPEIDLIEKGREFLAREWQSLSSAEPEANTDSAPCDPELAEAIHRSINSRTKTYRYVLPTQLLAKVVAPSLDCRCLQAARGGKGAFDARSLCHKVIVDFDKQNDFVLGGSAEPYVNNPLRQPEVSAKYRSKQKDKEGWDDLCRVLEAVEKKNLPEFTRLIFRRTLSEIYGRLSEVSIIYPVPRRISLSRNLDLIRKYLAEHSGGDRMLAISSALFLLIGQQFGLFREVRRGNINAADAQSGLVADMECIGGEGEVVMAVEVKDRQIAVNQIKDKLIGARARQITEILFIAQGGIIDDQREEAGGFMEREFAAGQNIYLFNDLLLLVQVVLVLLGEKGRRKFLELIGRELDRFQSDIKHRRAWKNLLSEL